jgi:hypothetical protein
MVAVWPIGVPAVVFLTLYLNRAHLQVPLQGDTDKHLLVMKRFGLLFAPYRDGMVYWECCEMIRKLLQTGIVSIWTAYQS